jgi:hypothetical protein
VAKKYQSKSDYSARKAQNKGVKHGATRMGKGGRTMRTWDAKTARWRSASSATAGFTKPAQSPKTSWGSARTSGTYTPSYSRGASGTGFLGKGETGPFGGMGINQQRSRERQRYARAKAIKNRIPKKRTSYGLTARYSSKGLK